MVVPSAGLLRVRVAPPPACIWNPDHLDENRRFGIYRYIQVYSEKQDLIHGMKFNAMKKYGRFYSSRMPASIELSIKLVVWTVLLLTFTFTPVGQG